MRNSIKEILKSRHPATVNQLFNFLSENESFDEATFIGLVKRMVSEGSLKLSEPNVEMPPLDYLLSPRASAWFWSLTFLTVLASTGIYLIPDAFPVSIVRWILGSMLIGWLPGDATLRMVLPASNTGGLERLGLGVTLSLAITFFIALALNFTGLGLRFLPILLSLSTYTIVMAIAALARKYFGG